MTVMKRFQKLCLLFMAVTFDTHLPHVGRILDLSMAIFDQFLISLHCRHLLWTVLTLGNFWKKCLKTQFCRKLELLLQKKFHPIVPANGYAAHFYLLRPLCSSDNQAQKKRQPTKWTVRNLLIYQIVNLPDPIFPNFCKSLSFIYARILDLL